MINEKYKNLEIVLGRLLVKNKRYIYKTFLPDLEGINKKLVNIIIQNQIKVLRDTNFSVKEYIYFLKKHNVRKVNVDIPPQGIKLEKGCKLNFGFYYPWGYLTSGRTCEFDSTRTNYITLRPCFIRKCLKSYSMFKNNIFNTIIIKLGNAVLYKIKLEKIPSISLFQRIIYEVDILGKLDVFSLQN